MTSLAAWLDGARILAERDDLHITEIPAQGDRPTAYLVSRGPHCRELDSPLKLGVWLRGAGLDVEDAPGTEEAAREELRPALDEFAACAQVAVEPDRDH